MSHGTTFVTAEHMSIIAIQDIIHSTQAKTIDHAQAVLTYLRAKDFRNEDIVLDFSGVTWVTSLFTDKLVAYLSAYLGNEFEQKVQVKGIESTNVMFHKLWQFALQKIHNGTVSAQA